MMLFIKWISSLKRSIMNVAWTNAFPGRVWVHKSFSGDRNFEDHSAFSTKVISDMHVNSF